ncbi:hypothetical protein IQ264_05475 [Phormidium sp. LEGE 05292]|uniref:hypothetical protein n=1 Tax=[Phormidium] sp. LEGE 05292 TaxID=767427 RepID=UPI001880B710|nr:hypothetical protein [Phormidium sp. LEGE 05292]MBE9224868.1 hypothetical protein [Phormidium sp. LEGE 05292]MBE9224915.1 hypothetical protein [Phormidium sp. LEGE 05292]
MIAAELALLTERHGEASKQVKMPHQYSGKFFAKTENQSQNHQNLNLHHLYIAEILTKLQVIYDAMVWEVITPRFRNWIASIYIQEAKERDAISDTLTVGCCDRCDTPFLECPTGLYGTLTLRDRFSRDQMTQQVIYDATLWKDMAAGSKISDTPFLECPTGLYGTLTLRDRSIHDAITQQPQSIYDATEWRSITPGSKNQTQKSRYIYDAMVWTNISMGDGIAPHLIISMTERHRERYFIYDAMS